MSERIARLYADYWQTFDEPAPLLYMKDLPDEEQIKLLSEAIASGSMIDPESFYPKDMGEGDTFY